MLGGGAASHVDLGAEGDIRPPATIQQHYTCARSQYWAMLGRLGFSLFQLKLSIIYTDNLNLVSLSYVERDNKKRKQNMFPFDFFVIDHFVANFDQKMLEKRDIKKNIFSMALGRTYA